MASTKWPFPSALWSCLSGVRLPNLPAVAGEARARTHSARGTRHSHVAVSESSLTARTQSGVYIVVPLGTISRATPREGRPAVELELEARSLSSLQLAADTLSQCGGALDDMAPQHRPSRACGELLPWRSVTPYRHGPHRRAGQVWALPGMHVLFTAPRVLDAVMVLLRDRAAAGKLQEAVAASVMAQSRDGPSLGSVDAEAPASQAMYEQESAIRDEAGKTTGKPAPKSSRTQLLPVHTSARVSSRASPAAEPASAVSTGQRMAGEGGGGAARARGGEEHVDARGADDGAARTDTAQHKDRPVVETPETVCGEEEEEEEEAEVEDEEGEGNQGEEAVAVEESSAPTPEAVPLGTVRSARGHRAVESGGQGGQNAARQGERAEGGHGQRRRMPPRRARGQAMVEDNAKNASAPSVETSTPGSDDHGKSPLVENTPTVSEPARAADQSPSGMELEQENETDEAYEEDGTPAKAGGVEGAAHLDQLLEAGGRARGHDVEECRSDSEEPAPKHIARRTASRGGRRGAKARRSSAPSRKGATEVEARARKRGRPDSAMRPRGGAMAVVESLTATPAPGEEDRGSTDDEASGAMRDALSMLLAARAKKRRRALGRRQATIKAAVRAKVEVRQRGATARCAFGTASSTYAPPAPHDASRRSSPLPQCRW